ERLIEEFAGRGSLRRSPASDVLEPRAEHGGGGGLGIVPAPVARLVVGARPLHVRLNASSAIGMISPCPHSKIGTDPARIASRRNEPAYSGYPGGHLSMPTRPGRWCSAGPAGDQAALEAPSPCSHPLPRVGREARSSRSAPRACS